MSSITRNHRSPKPLRVHAVTEDGRPLCGGGFQAKAVTAWQTDLAEPNCARCRAILARKNQPPATSHQPPATSSDE